MKTTRPYLTDLTDEQRDLLKPMLPPDKPRGRKWRVDLRDIINAILYLLRTDSSWRTLPLHSPGRGSEVPAGAAQTAAATYQGQAPPTPG